MRQKPETKVVVRKVPLNKNQCNQMYNQGFGQKLAEAVLKLENTN